MKVNEVSGAAGYELAPLPELLEISGRSLMPEARGRRDSLKLRTH
jgi:hypothetical protein